MAASRGEKWAPVASNEPENWRQLAMCAILAAGGCDTRAITHPGLRPVLLAPRSTERNPATVGRVCTYTERGVGEDPLRARRAMIQRRYPQRNAEAACGGGCTYPVYRLL